MDVCRTLGALWALRAETEVIFQLVSLAEVSRTSCDGLFNVSKWADWTHYSGFKPRATAARLRQNRSEGVAGRSFKIWQTEDGRVANSRSHVPELAKWAKILQCQFDRWSFGYSHTLNKDFAQTWDKKHRFGEHFLSFRPCGRGDQPKYTTDKPSFRARAQKILPKNQ